MAKAAKPTAEDFEAEEGGAPPKKSKKKLIFILLTLVLLAGGGVAAFLLLSPPPTPQRGGGASAEAARHAAVQAKFIDLGQFTANLMRESEDRYLQIAISLKITKPELEDKIKETKPEILHRVNMLLQSKYPSDLATIDGKERLARQIGEQVEYVLGLRKTAPAIGAGQDVAPGETGVGRNGVSDVLFTSFIIQ